MNFFLFFSQPSAKKRKVEPDVNNHNSCVTGLKFVYLFDCFKPGVENLWLTGCIRPVELIGLALPIRSDSLIISTSSHHTYQSHHTTHQNKCVPAIPLGVNSWNIWPNTAGIFLSSLFSWCANDVINIPWQRKGSPPQVESLDHCRSVVLFTTVMLFLLFCFLCLVSFSCIASSVLLKYCRLHCLFEFFFPPNSLSQVPQYSHCC